MEISIVIPVHNEAENLPLLYEELSFELAKIGRDYEIILVNDGSTDSSGEILDDFAGKDKRVKAIHLLRNYGQTCAMMAGFDNATGDIIIPMDGDNQNDPADIGKLLEKIDEGFDVVSGWRKDRQDATFTRIMPSMIANSLISKVSGVQLHDYGCTLKAYRKHVINDVKLYGEMHRFIPVYSTWSGGKVTEVVVNHRARKFGKSHYGLNRVLKVLLDLFVIKFLDKYMENPIHLFGGFGFASLFLAAVSFIMMFYYKFWGGKAFISTPLPVFFVLFTSLGVITILMGILAEMIMRTYYESQEKTPYRIKRIEN